MNPKQSKTDLYPNFDIIINFYNSLKNKKKFNLIKNFPINPVFQCSLGIGFKKWKLNFKNPVQKLILKNPVSFKSKKIFNFLIFQNPNVNLFYIFRHKKKKIFLSDKSN